MKYGSRHGRKTVVSQEETNLNLCNEEKLNKITGSLPPSASIQLVVVLQGPSHCSRSQFTVQKVTADRDFSLQR